MKSNYLNIVSTLLMGAIPWSLYADFSYTNDFSVGASGLTLAETINEAEGAIGAGIPVSLGQNFGSGQYTVGWVGEDGETSGFNFRPISSASVQSTDAPGANFAMSTTFDAYLNASNSGVGLVAMSNSSTLGSRAVFSPDGFQSAGYFATLSNVNGFDGDGAWDLEIYGTSESPLVTLALPEFLEGDTLTLSFVGTFIVGGDLQLDATISGATITGGSKSVSTTILSGDVLSGTHYGLFTSKFRGGNDGAVAFDDLSVSTTVIPEASSAALIFGVGALLLASTRKHTSI